ncbi:MAG: PKD domain-containing protein [Armatimonadota bacterium]
MITNVLSKWMRSGLIGITGVAFMVGLTYSTAFAQGQVLYGGKPADQAGIKIGSWGGGVAKEVTTDTYGGSRSVEVTPKGLYAGGRVDFNTPVDLTSAFNDENAYLQVVTKFGESKPKSGAGIFPGMGDLFGGGRANTRNAAGVFGGMAGMPGMMPGMGGLGMPGTAGKAVPSKRMQVIVEFDNGQLAECQVEVSSFNTQDDGWMNLSFPLSAIKGTADIGSYKIKRIALSGDGTEMFHIGEIRTDHDITALNADAGDDKEVAKNDRVSFVGYSNSGASAVKYSWDFDSSDGIQEDNIGEIVYHRFRESGNYVITLTVSDAFGIKKPAVSTIKVKVND